MGKSYEYIMSSIGDLYIPNPLFDDSEFWDLSCGARVLYSYYYNTTWRSRENGWVDKDGRYFIICNIEKAAKCLDLKREDIINYEKELCDFGLLECASLGHEYSDMIYVKNFARSYICSSKE